MSENDATPETLTLSKSTPSSLFTFAKSKESISVPTILRASFFDVMTLTHKRLIDGVNISNDSMFYNARYVTVQIC